jgi:hypothetical protein
MIEIFEKKDKKKESKFFDKNKNEELIYIEKEKDSKTKQFYILEYSIDDDDNPIIIGKRFLSILDEKNKSQELPKEKLIKINNILYLKEDIPYSEDEYSQIIIKVITNSDGRKIIVDQDNDPIPELENGNFYIPLLNEKKKNNDVINVIMKINRYGEKKFIRNDTEEEVQIAFIRKINVQNQNEYLIFKIDLREFSDLMEIVKISKKKDLITGREYLINIDSNKEIKGYIKEFNQNGEGYFVKEWKKYNINQEKNIYLNMIEILEKKIKKKKVNFLIKIKMKN